MLDAVKNLIVEKLGDEVGVEIAHPVKNGVEKTGFVISEKMGVCEKNISPILYLPSSYEEWDAEEVADYIVESYKKAINENHDLDSLNLSVTADSLEISVRNARNIPDFDAKGVIYKAIPDTDLIEVAYAVAAQYEDGTARFPVTRTSLKGGDLESEDDDAIIELAKKNTRANAEIRLTPLEDMINLLMFGGDPGIQKTDASFEDCGTFPILVANGKRNLNGSWILSDQETMQKLYKRLGEKLFILPSSIHELLILPQSAGLEEMGVDGLIGMVRDVNQTVVSSDDFLSDQVFSYDGVLKAAS